MRITYGFISADLLFFSWSVNVSMKKKTDRLCLLLMLLILCCCAGARGEETMNCYTDKSMYAPGETICLRAVEMPPFDRRITELEYDSVLSYMMLLGIEDGYTQDFSSAERGYTPSFDLTGL